MVEIDEQAAPLAALDVPRPRGAIVEAIGRWRRASQACVFLARLSKLNLSFAVPKLPLSEKSSVGKSAHHSVRHPTILLFLLRCRHPLPTIASNFRKMRDPIGTSLLALRQKNMEMRGRIDQEKLEIASKYSALLEAAEEASAFCLDLPPNTVLYCS